MATTVKSVGIIGTGSVGAALATALNTHGYRITSLSGRNAARTEGLARRLSEGGTAAGAASGRNEDTMGKSDAVFFCLPDDALASEIKRLADLPVDCTGKYVYHTSGALSSAVFGPLQKRGALPASFHPLQTFPKDGGEVSFKNVAIAVEGDPAAVAYALEIVDSIGAHPLLLDSGQKTLYHAAASMASNGLVGLSGVVEEMVASVGLEADGREYFYRLMSQSLENSRQMTAEKAITGPASRGDISTLKQHLNTLREAYPHLVPVYVVIGSHCVSLAIRNGRLTPEQGEAILDLFSNELQGLTI
jgi:predicted short-subunit dehydrogenase-like oxidoreductase (DUF2520 family)